MKDEPEEKQSQENCLEQDISQREEKALFKACGQRCQMSQGSNEVKAEKPLFFQWSGRTSSKEQEVRHEHEVQR